MAKTNGITLGILMEHMRGMEHRLMSEIRDTKNVLGKLDVRVGHLEVKVDRIERKTDLISMQITSLDDRLDDIEIVQIPKLKKAVRH